MARSSCTTCHGGGVIPTMNWGYGYMGVCQECDGKGYTETMVPISRWNGSTFERVWVPANNYDDDD